MLPLGRKVAAPPAGGVPCNLGMFSNLPSGVLLPPPTLGRRTAGPKHVSKLPRGPPASFGGRAAAAPGGGVAVGRRERHPDPLLPHARRVPRR